MPRKKIKPSKQLSAILSERVRIKPQGNSYIITMIDTRKRKSSPSQKEGQSKFKMAVAHAKALLKDPRKRAAYEKNLKGYRNANQRAVSEFMKK